MSESGPNTSISRELSELVRTLEDLRHELEPGDRRGLRPQTATELRRFTTDVTIQALILVLETNVRALKLVQRALRIADEGGGTGHPSGAGDLGRRTYDVTRDALTRLDDVLADVDDALQGTPTDDEARDLLGEARDLQSTLETQLREYDATVRNDDHPGTVPVDVDAELDAIKDRLADDDDGPQRSGT